jgi:3-oxoacid CoA-transferase subunit A
MAKKLFHDAKSALEGVLKNDMLIASGGFGLCGLPEACWMLCVTAG